MVEPYGFFVELIQSALGRSMADYGLYGSNTDAYREESPLFDS